ncbi:MULTISPECIES: MaoC family dehydratase [Rhizobium]|uniref:MaoC family dehydratase n=1 Tax=Rhizobium straminoryzae TaxID=1387186 RepID=A0A549TDK6_9HYPH|nr:MULTISPECIES: MaoC family dehydratase [Rhizobium]TRL40148.1 MaoC family dehydratase [Rhizobium straminoryzae]
MSDATLHFEDFVPERQFPLGPKIVSAKEIIEFAAEFDPQPMHLSEAAGKASILGGLAASGWHTCAMMMRMIVDSFIGRSTCQGAPGVEQMDWKKPVLAGDTLKGFGVVLEARPLKSRPGIGIVRMRTELRNQRAETVCIAEQSIMFRMRESGENRA